MKNPYFEKISAHLGHEVECITYGEPAVNAAVECVDCGVVIIDFDADAAAPEMLEILNKIAAEVDGLNVSAELWEAVHAAIAKAEGKSS